MNVRVRREYFIPLTTGKTTMQVIEERIAEVGKEMFVTNFSFSVEGMLIIDGYQL